MTEQTEIPAATAAPASAVAAPTAPQHPPVEKHVEATSPTSVIGPNANVHSPPSPQHDVASHTHAAPAISHPEKDHVKTVDPISPSSLKTEGGSLDRDAALAKVEQTRTLSHIKAWEDSYKSKALNRYEKDISKIVAWENAKKAAAEAQLRQEEEKLEKKKAALIEKMNNRIVAAHKAAAERKAMVEAKRGQAIVKADEMAAKYRISGKQPSGFLCFSA